MSAPSMSEDGVIRNKTRLTLERRHQLIDLNKDYVNFEIFFECRSADATKDFEMLVINQEQLNTVDLANLVLKKTRGGYISGNIVADEDRYQNYFLVIRSLGEDQTVDVELDINIKPTEAAKRPELPPAPPVEQPLPPLPIAEECSGGDKKTWSEYFKKNYLIILFVVILVGVTAYYVYTRYYVPGAAAAIGGSCAAVTASVAVEKAESVASSSHSSAESAPSEDGGSETGIIKRLINSQKKKPTEEK
jgi:hypothetical protein